MGRQRTGSIVQRGGEWYARVTLHREPHPEGSRAPRAEIKVTRDDGGKITEAFARLVAHKAQLRYDEGSWMPSARGTPPRPEITVLEHVDAWLERQAYTEAVKDRARVAAWLPRTALASLPLASVTPRDVAAFVAALKALPSAKGKKPAPRSVRNVCDPVARAMRAAVFDGLLPADPWAVLPTSARPQSVDADPRRRGTMRLGRKDVEKLLSGEYSEDRRVLYALLLLTGLRIGEAVALRWCDVLEDKPLRRVVVAEQWHQRLKQRTATKTRTPREVPCHPILAGILDAWRGQWREWYGRAPKPADMIVPARNRERRGVGSARRQAAVYRDLHLDLARCGLDKHRVHDLRHTFISLCADAGVAAEVAQRWTHVSSGSSARHLYLVPSWDRQCAEVARIKLSIRHAGGRAAGAAAGSSA